MAGWRFWEKEEGVALAWEAYTPEQVEGARLALKSTWPFLVACGLLPAIALPIFVAHGIRTGEWRWFVLFPSAICIAVLGTAFKNRRHNRNLTSIETRYVIYQNGLGMEISWNHDKPNRLLPTKWEEILQIRDEPEGVWVVYREGHEMLLPSESFEQPEHRELLISRVNDVVV